MDHIPLGAICIVLFLVAFSVLMTWVSLKIVRTGKRSDHEFGDMPVNLDEPAFYSAARLTPNTLRG